MNNNKESNVRTSAPISWYPGHMVKTKKQMLAAMKLVDIVYEVIDARIPYSSRIQEIDSLIKSKLRIIIMTKMDLCDKIETEKWITYYKKKGYQVIGVDLKTNPNLKPLLSLTNELVKPLKEKREQQGLKPRKTRVMVIGIPNAGKSTLINSLVGKKVTRVGNKPGVTKILEWIRINNELELLDTPGILWPKLGTEEIALNLASLTAIKEEILPLDKVGLHILKKLNYYYPFILKERYNIEKIDFKNIESTLNVIGSIRGCLIKGGQIDYDQVFRVIINDVKQGIIKGVTFDRYNGNNSLKG